MEAILVSPKDRSSPPPPPAGFRRVSSTAFEEGGDVGQRILCPVANSAVGQGPVEIPAPAPQGRLRPVEQPGRIGFAHIAVARNRNAEVGTSGAQLVELGYWVIGKPGNRRGDRSHELLNLCLECLDAGQQGGSGRASSAIDVGDWFGCRDELKPLLHRRFHRRMPHKRARSSRQNRKTSAATISARLVLTMVNPASARPWSSPQTFDTTAKHVLPSNSRAARSSPTASIRSCLNASAGRPPSTRMRLRSGERQVAELYRREEVGELPRRALLVIGQHAAPRQRLDGRGVHLRGDLPRIGEGFRPGRVEARVIDLSRKRHVKTTWTSGFGAPTMHRRGRRRNIRARTSYARHAGLLRRLSRRRHLPKRVCVDIA